MDMTIKEIRETGIPIPEIKERYGLSEGSIIQRIRLRGLKPIGRIGKLAFFSEADVQKIVTNLALTGPKPGKRARKKPEDE
ncbi:MAG: hypothetical protein LBG73_08050 [Spirochaetaceae bacterium]|jgi:hypothetical protein|nr:hypothetical protein [Spirochaetaceae bacterium]